MSIVFRDDWLTVHQGDVRAVLATLDPESIDAVVTSPPYWRQRSYLDDADPAKSLELGTEPTLDEWIGNLVEVCTGIRRVLRPQGSLWLVLGDRYVAHGGQYANTDRRRRSEDFRQHAPRRTTLRGYPAGLRRKSLVLAPYRLAIALCEDGWILRDRVVWAKTNGLPESVGDRLSVRDEVIFRFTLRERAYFDLDAIREGYAPSSIARVQGHRAQTFSGAKKAPPGQPPRTPRAPLFGGNKGPADGVTRLSGKAWEPKQGKNPGNVWPMATAARPGTDFAHFAMFPPELVRRPILATVPPGGVVLDPFAGTGTTADVANQLLRRAVLIELDPASIAAIAVRTQRRSIAEARP